MIDLYATLRRLHRRCLALVLVAVVAGAVVWAHSAPGSEHMDAHHAVAACLAVVALGAVTLIAASVPGARFHRGPPELVSVAGHQRSTSKPLARTRDGPLELQVLRL